MRSTRAIAACGAVALLALAGLGVALVAGGSTTLQGALAASAFGALALALVAVARRLAPPELDEEDRAPSFTELPTARRRLLLRLLFGGTFVVGLASLFPLRSLSRRASRSLGETMWRRGSRLVTGAGRPVRAGELDAGSILTVWPEGHPHAHDSQVVLIRLPEGTVIGGPGRPDWAIGGHVAYSKLCTHMGCPVGLYQQETRVLLCPCHQASFDVVGGGQPLVGPASRPLPQLPLEVDDEGYLVAGGAFEDEVGPGYWSRPA